MNFRFKKADLGVFNSADSDAAVLSLKNGKDRIVGLTNGRFSLIDLIHSLLKITGPAHVVCCTWSAGIKDAHQVRWMMDSGNILTWRLLTDHSYKNRQPKYALALDDLFTPDAIRTSEVHAKFVLVHNDNFKLAIRTSMNLNANRTCEFFEIDNDQEIFDFFMSFCEHTFGEMPRGFVADSSINVRVMESFFNSNSEELKRTAWYAM